LEQTRATAVMQPEPELSSLPSAVRQARVITAAALFDGHDAAIHIMRRILQAHGAEVIHLGHDRSVDEIVDAAVQEDAHAVAVSSYQGGHMEFFRYLIDRLRACGAAQVRVFGGGGGTILPEEARALEAYGVARIFGPEDGRRLGLVGMIAELLAELDVASVPVLGDALDRLAQHDSSAMARTITWLE
jgi:isobutyryl-CoA mutase